MKRKIKVTISRGKGNVDTFNGWVVDENNLFYRVAHDHNPIGEWFAKSSACVNCYLA